MGVGPSLLLHPTDFLDERDVPEMSFFPAMKIPSERKIELVRHTLSTLRDHWSPGTMLDHARKSGADVEGLSLQKALA